MIYALEVLAADGRPLLAGRAAISLRPAQPGA
jgi:hypothetical protein